jgi:hypothetical protein
MDRIFAAWTIGIGEGIQRMDVRQPQDQRRYRPLLYSGAAHSTGVEIASRWPRARSDIEHYAIVLPACAAKPIFLLGVDFAGSSLRGPMINVSQLVRDDGSVHREMSAPHVGGGEIDAVRRCFGGLYHLYAGSGA